MKITIPVETDSYNTFNPPDIGFIIRDTDVVIVIGEDRRIVISRIEFEALCTYIQVVTDENQDL